MAGCTETLLPFRLPLDLPGNARSAVVRALVDGEAKVAAIDLMSGAGAEALIDGSYQGAPVELNAFTYDQTLDYVGLKPGLLTFEERGDKLWAPRGRFDRIATPELPGSWAPKSSADSPLDEFSTTLVRGCTPYHPQLVELDAAASGTQIRTVVPLKGDRVAIVTRDAHVHVISFTRESAQVSSRTIHPPPVDLKGATLGPDDRIWAELSIPRAGAYQLVVETSTGGFRTAARRDNATLGTTGLYLLSLRPDDPHRLYGMTAFGGLVSYDEARDRWTKLLDPLRLEPVLPEDKVYCFEKNDEVSPNYFCGGTYFEGPEILALDPAGRGSVRRITTDSTTISSTLLDDPPAAVVTAVGRSPLGLTVVRGNTTQSSVQYYEDGRWQSWKSLIPTLRMYGIDSTGFERLVMVGIRGAMLEYFGDEPCTDVIPSVTPYVLGKLVRTEHALVMTYGDRGEIANKIPVFIYWIDR